MICLEIQQGKYYRIESDFTMKNLIIFGAGQYGQVAREVAEAMKEFDRIDFADDNNPAAVGKTEEFLKGSSEYNCAVVAIGNPDVRIKLLDELENSEYEIVTLISPRACISHTAEIGKGCIIEANSMINTATVLGRGVIVSANAVVNHNSVVEDGCHIDVGAVVPANETVQKGKKITLM